MSMPQNHRPPGPDVIDITVSISVKNRITVGVINKDRFSPHRTAGPDGTVDASGNDFAGPCKKVLRFFFAWHMLYVLSVKNRVDDDLLVALMPRIIILKRFG
jgi:hypothetical protein